MKAIYTELLRETRFGSEEATSYTLSGQELVFVIIILSSHQYAGFQACLSAGMAGCPSFSPGGC